MPDFAAPDSPAATTWQRIPHVADGWGAAKKNFARYDRVRQLLLLDMDEVASTDADGGRPVAWEEQLVRHGRWLRTVILARTGEAQGVEDVFQEVAMAAVRQRAPLADPTKVCGWLYQLAVRQSLLYRRQLGRRRRIQRRWVDAQDSGTAVRYDPASWLMRVEQQDLVRRALAQLAPRDREILLLKYSEDWSYQQLAQQLGVSQSAVEARLHRARQRLRQLLTQGQYVESVS